MIEKYLGRPFELGESDCFSLIREYYHDVFGIDLPDVARPHDFWEAGLELYRKHYAQQGFEVLHLSPHEWQHGDIILMSVLSPVANHAAILMPDGKILHHMYGRLSEVGEYRGIWRNNTVGVYRHREVALQEDIQMLDIREARVDHD